MAPPAQDGFAHARVMSINFVYIRMNTSKAPTRQSATRVTMSVGNVSMTASTIGGIRPFLGQFAR